MTEGCQEQVGGEAKEVSFWFGSLGDGGAIEIRNKRKSRLGEANKKQSKMGKLQSGV